jgi:hypothetical protein
MRLPYRGWFSEEIPQLQGKIGGASQAPIGRQGTQGTERRAQAVARGGLQTPGYTKKTQTVVDIGRIFQYKTNNSHI